MRTDIILAGMRGIVVAATVISVLAYPAHGAPNPYDDTKVTRPSLQITTNTNADTYQFAIGGEHGVSTVFSSDGTVTTSDDEPAVPDPANHAAAPSGTAIAAQSKSAAVATSTADSNAGSDTILPHPKSKFRKLIFAAAVVPVAVFALIWKSRRSAASKTDQFAEMALVPLAHPIAGINMGHIDNRTEAPTTPANHPWYA